MLKTKKRSPLMRLLSAATALGAAAFMLPAMPKLSAAAASYDLKIAGTQVTPENASDILGNGVFSYDASGNVLTINGDCTYGDDIIYSKIDDLTINVASDSVLHATTYSCLALNRFTTITGNGKLTLKSDGQYAKAIQSATLTIQDAELDIDSNYLGIYSSSGGRLYIRNSTIRITAADEAICSFWNVELTDCAYSIPSDLYYDFESQHLYQNWNGEEGEIAKNVKIVSGETYDLWIGSTQVNDRNASDILRNGVFSYDKTGNVLTISGNYTCNGEIIHSENSGLTINVASDSVLHATDRCCIVLDESATITGAGKLTLKSDAEYFTTLLCWKTLTIQDAVLDIDSNFVGIGGPGADSDMLTIRKSMIDITARSEAIREFGTVNLTDCEYSIPSSVYYNSGHLYQSWNGSSGVTAKTVKIIKSEVYDIYICGEHVNSSNANDILGDGSFRFDPADNTLYLSGDAMDSAYPVIWNQINGLTLNVVSDSSLLGDGQVCIYTKGSNMTITGNGKLSLNSTGDYSIIADGQAEVTIKDANLYAECGISGCGSEKLTVINSEVHAEDEFAALCDFGKGIMLQGCKIEAPANAVISNAGNVCNANGSYAKVVDIVPAASAQIVTQPTGKTSTIGATAKFTVSATGSDLTYQWQNYTSSGWKDSGLATAKTATLSVPVTAARDGFKYRCVINGDVISNAAVLKVKPAFTTQPSTFTGKIGDTAKFTVATSGAGTLSYQWQCDTGKGFKDSTASGAKTKTMSIPVTAARDGYKYRCIVKSSNGTSATSNAATLKVKTAITTQPTGFSGKIGDTAKFTVAASGAGTLSYQWQNYTSSGWKDSGLATAKTAELSVPVTAARDGYKYRCIVKSSNGTSATSGAATLTVKAAITTQPKNVSAVIGATAKFTVAASGAGTLSYQWQCDTGKGFKDSTASGAKTATLSIPVAAARDGYKYRCIVKSSNGTSATSKTVTLTVKTAITTQPKNYTGAIGTTAKFTVAASGVGTLSYQWQNYTSSGWKDSGLATAKTAELSVPVTAARNGYKYRCIVTSSNGTSATSNAVTLKVQ